MSNAIQILLRDNDKSRDQYLSGRGVRIRMIDPTEKDRAASNAASRMTKESTGMEYNAAVEREILLQAIMAVTKETKLNKETVMTATWEPLDFAKLELDASDFQYKKLFTGKDDSLLISISRRMHGATGEEVDAILGEAIPISDG